jgi:glycerate kinase
MEALQEALGGRSMVERVQGPMGTALKATWLRLPKGLAVIESAKAIGLERVAAGTRDAMKASSFGLGQLMLAAKRSGCREIWIGLGGSATTDAGLGMALALGSPQAMRGIRIRVLCDVDNPLYGSHGAAHVFAPQKGASPAQVRQLDQRLRRMAQFMRPGLAKRPGAGAAGGLGAGLMAFAGATLLPGAATLMALCKFHERLKRADWVVSGEGNFDAQSLRGKLPVVVAREALKAGKRCSLVCGKIHAGIELKGVELLELRALKGMR